jgi:ribosomal protein L11 methyltransferase
MWLEISVSVESQEAARSVCQLFDLYGQGGAVQERLFTEPDSADPLCPGPVTVKTYLPLDGGDDQRLRALRQELAQLSDLAQIPPAKFKKLEKRDWATAWKASFKPQRIGRRFVIKLPEQAFPSAEDDIVIDLEPGMAFGTGLHATTRMCLLRLEELVRQGDSLLDMGTGSGILAIAAVKLGAVSVLALDHDSTAVTVAEENIARNAVSHAVLVEEGSLDYLTERTVPPVNGIVVNIIADVIVDLLEQGLTRHLNPGGWLVAGGILVSAEASVRAAFDRCGMQTTNRYQEEEWITLCGTKECGSG